MNVRTFLYGVVYDLYCELRGTEKLENNMNISPQFKIKDNMAMFMSYTFRMNLAIKQYNKPSPPIYPLVIGFWIIPNRTVNLNDDGREVDNDIGKEGNLTQHLLMMHEI